MPGRSLFQPASTFGRFGNEQLESYLHNLSSQIAMEFDASYKTLGDARNIGVSVPTGNLEEAIETSIQEALFPLETSGLNTSLVPQKTVVAFAGTNAQARTLSGWGICDGTVEGGFRKPDLRHKFLRGAADGADSGGTGGADQSSVSLDSHSAHVDDFAVSIGEDPPSSTCCVQACASGVGVADDAHLHSVSASLTGSIEDHDDHVVTQGDNKPPYYEVIWIIKL